jgi:acyl-CoA synthetase (AMP-forming)/AMP-acid ligase II
LKNLNSGPAECSVYSNAHHVREDYLDRESIHVGPGTWCRCWIVSPGDHNKLLPIGAVGELLIEGPIVGRRFIQILSSKYRLLISRITTGGYLNDPDGTSAAFIEPPTWLSRFRKEYRGTRFYKTGDLGHYTSDGSFCCVGRKDDQVKLRGQRIELAEVEHHLRKCIRAARNIIARLVVLENEQEKPQILVAFVQLEDCKDGEKSKNTTSRIDEDLDLTKEVHATANSVELLAPTESFRSRVLLAESRLQAVVPEYMVPGVFIQVSRIPLTANGKTDGRRLQGLAGKLSRSELQWYVGSGKTKRMPISDIEKTLQRLWAQALNLTQEKIGKFHLLIASQNTIGLNFILLCQANSDIFQDLTTTLFG